MNLLPLYSFFEIIGYHPFHAFGIGGTGALRPTSECNDIVRRYAWQSTNAAGLHDLEQAIEDAETKLRNWLGFSVAPHYVVETLPWRGGSSVDGRWPTIQATEGEIRAVGVETLAAISAGATVTYSDSDGDGIEDTFAVSAATSITDTSQIAVYFSSGDRFSGWGATTALAPRWRVQPVRVTISGGVVTVRGPKQLCVRPVLYEGVTNVGDSGLAPDVSANFVTTLDIYQRYTGIDGTTVATSQAVLTWETRPCHGWWCCCATCSADPYSGSPHDPAAVAQAVARVGIRDARTGLLTPAEATYNSTTGIWSSLSATVCEAPDRVTLRYLAGYPLGSDGQMQEPYRTIVARMAAAELSEQLCGCKTANRELWRWQFDLARSSGANDEAYGAVSAQDLDGPFGTRRGQVEAWKAVRNLRMIPGIMPG
jgi:hypothetical protein